jgi:hypothetical protein
MTRDDHSLRRLAVQIASQLPEDPADARRVLDYARFQLVEFLAGNDERQLASVTVLKPVN